jgi:hypothetical protein
MNYYPLLIYIIAFIIGLWYIIGIIITTLTEKYNLTCNNKYTYIHTLLMGPIGILMKYHIDKELKKIKEKTDDN